MSNWPGNLIRKTPVTPAGPLQNGAAPGVWSLSEASYWTKQGLWPLAGNTLAVEDVFSTYLYTGNGSTQTITNGIDLAGKGGLVWAKSRTSILGHSLFDTNRGVNQRLLTNLTAASTATADSLTAFNSNGFNIGSSTAANQNTSAFASWTFRKAPNFFDIVTYTGTGANRNIAHNLGVAPGMIIVKRTDTTSDWQLYHRSNANTQYQVLNSTAAVATGATRWNSTTPTATEFTVGTDATVNASGGTYVAYLYAHDTASDGVIQCGSYVGNGSSTGPVITLGWEPQWILFKCINNSAYWYVLDNMRGMPVSGVQASLYPNAATNENGYSNMPILAPTATGFQLISSDSEFNGSGQTYIYMAIRRGPMRTPTLGTSVYGTSTFLASSPALQTSFPVDFVFNRFRNTVEGWVTSSRLTQKSTMTLNTTDAEAVSANFTFDYQNGVRNSGGTAFSDFQGWLFRRAPGFMDVVCYTGNGTAMNIPHNLGVAPELVVIKSRNNTYSWLVIRSGGQTGLILNSTNAQFSDNMLSSMGASSIQFAVNNTGYTENGVTYVAYLFASCPGVSKVGSYTGNGSSQTINCAFTTGARFVLIKRTDSTGDWYVWDSARGIVAGNDPYLALNSTAAEVTTNDSVDTDNTGFIVNQVAASNVNVNGATYIFLAIA